jgi:hypothetical protein
VTPTQASRRPLGALAALVIVVALILFDVSRSPSAVVPASAPDSVFSAERAMEHVRAIAERPHPPGSADHLRVRQYLEAELRRRGLEPVLQTATAVGTRFAVAGRVENVLARAMGTEPGSGAVLLVAHYDGVAAGPAAGDDASGTAVVLETLRALLAGPRPRHDVIVLLTDGEEAGLLGAAAFAREQPWAKDVRLVINFEARGTGGQAVMFQTGDGNLDQVRELRRVPDLPATSLAVTIYRLLPNDTDLSELFLLGQPALNFAFADGVERYHTSEDDSAHLAVGSVQQEGTAALALTRIFANGPLPRPRTGDAVFFSLPLVGLALYPEGWAGPLAGLALVALVIALVRVRRTERHWIRGFILGVVGLIASTALALGLAYLAVFRGPAGASAPGWRAVYAIGIALLALVPVLAIVRILRRWAGLGGLHLAGLVAWTALAVWVTIKAPGASFVLVWPALAGSGMAIAEASAASRSVKRVMRWTAIVVASVLVLPMVQVMSLTVLGVVGPGGFAVGLVIALLGWLLLPELELVTNGFRWTGVLATLADGILLVLIAIAGGRRPSDYPVRSILTYAEDADSAGGWLATAGFIAQPHSWEAGVLGLGATRIDPRDTSSTSGPRWLTRAFGPEYAMVAAPVARASLAAPTGTIEGDSASTAGRRFRVRIRPAPGTLSIAIRAIEGRVTSASVDGRTIDPGRYRQPQRRWFLDYTGPSDSGFVLDLMVPPDSIPSLELVAQQAGLPPIQGLPIPPRPPHVLASQTGDVSLVRRVIRLVR